MGLYTLSAMEESFHRVLCDSGMFPIPAMGSLAVDCLCVNSNYQEPVLRFQKAQQKVCPCSSSFLNS